MMLMLRQRQFIAGHFSVCTALDHVKANLGRIGGLELHLDAVQLPLEPLLGAGVDHLAPHARRVRRPSQTHIAISAMNAKHITSQPGQTAVRNDTYQAMKKILLFWQFSSVTKS